MTTSFLQLLDKVGHGGRVTGEQTARSHFCSRLTLTLSKRLTVDEAVLFGESDSLCDLEIAVEQPMAVLHELLRHLKRYAKVQLSYKVGTKQLTLFPDVRLKQLTLRWAKGNLALATTKLEELDVTGKGTLDLTACHGLRRVTVNGMLAKFPGDFGYATMDPRSNVYLPRSVRQQKVMLRAGECALDVSDRFTLLRELKIAGSGRILVDEALVAMPALETLDVPWPIYHAEGWARVMSRAPSLRHGARHEPRSKVGSARRPTRSKSRRAAPCRGFWRSDRLRVYVVWMVLVDVKPYLGRAGDVRVRRP